MTTSEELQSQIVLPQLESEKTLPTQIHEIDEKIAWLNSEITNITKQISEARIDRDLLIKRAKEIVCLDDGKYKIVEVPVYPKKRVNVEVLKRDYPDKLKRILANIAERIKDKAEQEVLKSENFISQSDVKSVVRDKTALAKIIPEQTEPERYETTVVKRE